MNVRITLVIYLLRGERRIGSPLERTLFATPIVIQQRERARCETRAIIVRPSWPPKRLPPQCGRLRRLWDRAGDVTREAARISLHIASGTRPFAFGCGSSGSYSIRLRLLSLYNWRMTARPSGGSNTNSQGLGPEARLATNLVAAYPRGFRRPRLANCFTQGERRVRAIGQSANTTAVSPGPLKTRAASGITQFDELVDAAVARGPSHRLVEIAEVRRAVAFLVGGGASGMTGNTIYVDAGLHIMA